MIGEVAGANLWYVSSIRCSGARLLSSFDPALPSVNMNDTFTFTTGVILSVNVLNDDEEEESIVLFQSDPLKKPVSYKVGNPTPIQADAPNAFVAW